MATFPEFPPIVSPSVSIILPTYNRLKFLAVAFHAIREQVWDDWELIVIDDGSTDGTGDLIPALSREMPRPVRYSYQQNQGAYAARNAGLDLARGKYIAFYDSDDIWLPHHLADCVAALSTNPDVDWVYGSCRMINLASGEILASSTFYEKDRPRPFLKLRTRQVGLLRIIEDPDANRLMILHGLYCGLQNSVIRRSVFETERFRVRPRHEAEDQIIVIRALSAGAKLAYFDHVHVIYHVHPENSSGASGGAIDKLLQITQQLIIGMEDLGREVHLSGSESRALKRRLAREYFWHLGYALLWNRGDRDEAMKAFRRGLRIWPWDLWCWKSYFLALLRFKTGVIDRG